MDIKKIDTKDLKAAVYDMSQQVMQLNHTIKGINTEIAARLAQEAPPFAPPSMTPAPVPNIKEVQRNAPLPAQPKTKSKSR